MSLLVSLALLTGGALGAEGVVSAAQDGAPADQEAPAARATAEWSAPGLWLAGAEFPVTLRLEAPEGGLTLPVWALSPAAFEVAGKPLAPRGEGGSLTLQSGQVVETILDLGAALGALAPKGAFELACALEGASAPQQVVSPVAVEAGLDFMAMEAEQLAQFEVVMMTNRGVLWFELWPEVAPNHVRNFLDLASSGFYAGTGFHRVIPGFMIQGGRAKPGTPAPRRVQAEFNARKHEAGVLSAARLGNDVNSADSQFFVMHRNYPSLNGRYSAFGKLKSGMEVVEKIVVTGDSRFSPQTERGFTPTTPQTIERAIVVRAARGAEQAPAPKDQNPQKKGQ